MAMEAAELRVRAGCKAPERCAGSPMDFDSKRTWEWDTGCVNFASASVSSAVNATLVRTSRNSRHNNNGNSSTKADLCSTSSDSGGDASSSCSSSRCIGNLAETSTRGLFWNAFGREWRSLEDSKFPLFASLSQAVSSFRSAAMRPLDELRNNISSSREKAEGLFLSVLVQSIKGKGGMGGRHGFSLALGGPTEQERHGECHEGLEVQPVTIAEGFSHLGFARIEPPRKPSASSAAAMKRVEYYMVHRVRPDGRCMFRALVQGMASNRGMSLSDEEETSEADELRLAVADALCRSEKRRAQYEEALIAITVEESLNRYCQRITRSDFWGGESELLVLSRMCAQPITVYISEAKAKQGTRWGTGFVAIAEYGSEFLKQQGPGRGPRKPVRLLYNGSDHYDLLV